MREAYIQARILGLQVEMEEQRLNPRMSMYQDRSYPDSLGVYWRLEEVTPDTPKELEAKRVEAVEAEAAKYRSRAELCRTIWVVLLLAIVCIVHGEVMTTMLKAMLVLPIGFMFAWLHLEGVASRIESEEKCRQIRAIGKDD